MIQLSMHSSSGSHAVVIRAFHEKLLNQVTVQFMFFWSVSINFEISGQWTNTIHHQYAKLILSPKVVCSIASYTTVYIQGLVFPVLNSRISWFSFSVSCSCYIHVHVQFFTIKLCEMILQSTIFSRAPIKRQLCINARSKVIFFK